MNAPRNSSAEQRTSSSPLRNKLSRFKAQLPFLPWALSLVWRCAPRLTVAWLILLFAGGVLPAATLYVTRALVNQIAALGSETVAAGAAEGWVDLRPILPTCLVLAGLLLGAELLRGINAIVLAAQSERVKDRLSGLIQDQSMTVDLAFYDRAEFFDRLHRARSEAGYRPLRLIESMGGALQAATTLLAMLAVLAPYGLWLPLALMLGSLPAFWVVLSHALQQHEWTQRVTPDERRTWYYDWLLTARETAAEIRALSLGAHFRAVFDALRSRIRHEHVALARRRGLAGLAASAATLLVGGAVAAWMVLRYVRRELTLGDLAIVLVAMQQVQRLAATLLENAGRILGDSLFLGNLHEFLALTPSIVSGPIAKRPAPNRDVLLRAAARSVKPPAIRCRDVSFRYPDSERRVLDGLSLEVASGHLVALVGGNGAGKTTLLKLLCRFYDAQQGTIEVDGVDLRQLDLEELRRGIAVLFQTPIGFNASAAENIAFGDLHASSSASVQKAARDTGADEVVARLPHGYETQLGVWSKGGVDLSVGEWQRLALARAYLRDAPLLLLDEPTSAMDPWAEAEWLRSLRDQPRQRTTVVVTHRLTTARQADVIHVMEAGRVVESGSHDQLMSRCGRYAALWSAREGAAECR